jgi:hypothetical protein
LPALLLLVVGIINTAALIGGLMGISVFSVGHRAAIVVDEEEDSLPSIRVDKGESRWVALTLAGIAGPVIIAGAQRMRRLTSYRAAWLATILAFVAPPGIWLGIPAGIWSLWVLTRRVVRQGFRIQRARRLGMA